MGNIVDDGTRPPFRIPLEDSPFLGLVLKIQSFLEQPRRKRKKKKRKRKEKKVPVSSPNFHREIENEIQIPSKKLLIWVEKLEKKLQISIEKQLKSAKERENDFQVPKPKLKLTEEIKKEGQLPSEIMLKWYEVHNVRPEQQHINNKINEREKTKEKGNTFKIFIAGDLKLDKTALILNNVDRAPSEISSSIGANFLVKNKELYGKKINLRIWDTRSEDRFRFLIPAYARGANGAILVYDFNNPKSLNLMSVTIDIIRKNAGDIPIFLAITELRFNAEMLESLNELYEFTELFIEERPQGDQAIELLIEKIIKLNERKG